MEVSLKKDKHLQWLSEEMKLNYEHEELLAKREMLLVNTSAVYEKKEKHQKATKVDFLKAKSRNDQLVEEVERIQEGLRKKGNSSTGAAFIALRESYLKEAGKEWKENWKK